MQFTSAARILSEGSFQSFLGKLCPIEGKTEIGYH